MTDMRKIAEQIRNNPALSGVKVEVVNIPQKADGTADIGNLLGNKQVLSPTSNISTETNNIKNQTLMRGVGIEGTPEAEKEVVSKEMTKYKDKLGTLIRFADGSLMFQIDKMQNDKIYRFVLNFNNENDYKKEKPYSQVLGQYSNELNGFKKCQEETYKYHRNGKIAKTELKNADGIVINQAEYNRKGKITKKIVNDKDGNLKFTYKYKYENDETRLYEKYDKDNKLVETGTTKYNGDKPVSTEVKYPSGQVKAQREYDENGKLHTQKEYYENGQLKTDIVYHDNGVIKTQTTYDENGNITGTITDEIDGHFDNSSQVSEGDCYLLSAINGIRSTAEGQKILSDLVQVSTNANGEKVYTVTFPGAKLAAEGLKTDDRIKPGTVAITGTYTFTESEMQEILKQAGQKYSLGDGDIVLLEAAFEKYRLEVSETLKANDIDPKSVSSGEAGLITGPNENNILASGYSEDAFFILTGKTSDVYRNKNPQYGLSSEALHDGELVVTPIPQKRNSVSASSSIKATSSIDNITNEQDELDKMLDTIMTDGQDGKIDNVATASFVIVHKDGNKSGHAFTIKSVTENTVTLINPWHPDKEITMSRDDFKQSVKKVTLASMDKPSEDNNSDKPNIKDIINRIIGQYNED